VPKIIIIGHSLFKLLQKCSHMLFFETQCSTATAAWG